MTSSFKRTPHNLSNPTQVLNRRSHFELPYIPSTVSLPNVAKGKFRPNVQLSFCKISENKKHHVKEQAENFFLNGHIIGFHPQTQKLEPPCTA